MRWVTALFLSSVVTTNLFSVTNPLVLAEDKSELDSDISLSQSTSVSSEAVSSSEDSQESSSQSSTIKETSQSTISTQDSTTSQSKPEQSSSSSQSSTNQTTSSTKPSGGDYIEQILEGNAVRPAIKKQPQSKQPKPNNSIIQAPISFYKSQSTIEFIEEIGEQARDIGQKNDLYASVMIAQAILESASGNSSLARQPNYNLFGIKGNYQNEAVEMATLEDDGSGGMFTITSKFRKYPSYKESLEDYAKLMTGGTSAVSSYYQPAWKSTTKNYREATRYLTGRYATDTRYDEKLNGLIETYELTQFDTKKATQETVKKSKVTEDFIEDIAKDVEKIAEKEDMYASVLIAEAVIQSQSGQSKLSDHHNLYQVEGKHNGKSIKIDTLKVNRKNKQRKPELKQVSYKEYPSYATSIEDYIKLIKQNKQDYKERTKTTKDSYRKVTAYMTAKNEEDRKYHKKLNGIINTYDLTKYDKSESKDEPNEK